MHAFLAFGLLGALALGLSDVFGDITGRVDDRVRRWHARRTTR